MRKKKIRGEIYKKLDHEYVRDLGVNKIPSYDYSWRRGAEANNIPSHVTTTQFVPARISMTDPMSLAKESKETQDAILAKSKRLAPLYSKGAVQYITDDENIKQLGRKIK